MSSTCVALCQKSVALQHLWQNVLRVLIEWREEVFISLRSCWRALLKLLGWSSHRLEGSLGGVVFEMTTGSLFSQSGFGQHAWVGRPSLSRKDSHVIVLFACFHGPAARRRFRSTRVLVSHVLERSRRSVMSARSGRRIERRWISLGSAWSVAQLAKSVVVSVPVWWDIFPLWKVYFPARERAMAWSSVTECGCVRVQLKECVDLRSSRWWPVEWGVSIVRSVFVS